MKRYDLRKLFLLIGFILMSRYFTKDFISLPAYLGEFFRGIISWRTTVDVLSCGPAFAML